MAYIASDTVQSYNQADNNRPSNLNGLGGFFAWLNVRESTEHLLSKNHLLLLLSSSVLSSSEGSVGFSSDCSIELLEKINSSVLSSYVII